MLESMLEFMSELEFNVGAQSWISSGPDPNNLNLNLNLNLRNFYLLSFLRPTGLGLVL